MGDGRKILVTGAAGFIGQHLISELLTDDSLHIIASSKSAEDVEGFEWLNRVEFIPLDLNSFSGNLYKFFSEPDLLIHLSWEGLPHYRELFHFEKNLFNQYAFLKNLIVHGLTDLTVSGSCFEYGLQNGCLSEGLDTRPVTCYGLAKDTLRKFLDELGKKHVFSCKWVRFFYLHGRGQHSSAIIPQLQAALAKKEEVFNMSAGEQLRDYLPVTTAAACMARIARQNKICGIMNCCSGKPISIRQLIENYLRESGENIRLNLGHYPYPDYEPMAFWGDDSKLRQILAVDKDIKS